MRTLLPWLVLASSAFGAEKSHPPMRALPTPSMRPLGTGNFVYADPVKGDDKNDGTKDKPWRTLKHSFAQLKAGDTLLLRGGTYYETVVLSHVATAEKPTTIRSHPGEIAVLDGGLREFFEEPTKAWEPVADGEYRSTKEYAELDGIVLGHFGDSMVPLHGYRHLVDLKCANPYWTIKSKLEKENGFYCGPGLWNDPKTKRLHVRLAHTGLPLLGDDNYTGETDPRKLPLCVAGLKVPLTVEKAQHVRIVDLVVRGGSRATISLSGVKNVELDGVIAYGGSPALSMQNCEKLKIVNSAIRGVSAPWSSRAGHKYRGPSSYVLIARGGGSGKNREIEDAVGTFNRDIEIAHSELTDSHDGPFIGSIKRLQFHHNLVDNFNDDGIYMTAMGDGGDVHIHQNVITRCLHAFSYYGTFKPGSGTWVYRNIIDLRRPVPYFWPVSADDPTFPPAKEGEPRRWPWTGRLCGDHGSPIWEPLNFYHNTVVSRDAAFRDYYGAGAAGHVNSKRTIFNNLFVQLEGIPGVNFDPPDDSLLEADGNLHWGLRDGPGVKGDLFAKFRSSPRFKSSQKHYKPGWTTNDVFADPLLTKISADYRVPLDPRLREGSPAIDKGVALPKDWPDPLRDADKGKPDMGALPHGVRVLKVGR